MSLPSATGAFPVQEGISEPGFVALAWYDLYGCRVATLYEGTLAPGHHQVLFDVSHPSAGVYACVLSASGRCSMRLLAKE